jgi:hypothetical protein
MGTMSGESNLEAAIWYRLIRADQDDLSGELARFFLGLRFDADDLNRMHELVVKNQEGSLSADEDAQLRTYRRVGLQLDLLRAKAQTSLQHNPNSHSYKP